MKTFFNFRQNNSGGKWTGPAVNVLVEAKTLDEAILKSSPHITLCGDSGLYADYDDCGCCPCCGHRWTKPWREDREKMEDIRHLFQDGDLRYMGGVRLALIKDDGSLVIGDDTEKYQLIQSYVLS